MSRDLAEQLNPNMFKDQQLPSMISINDPIAVDGRAKLNRGWWEILTLDFPDILNDQDPSFLSDGDTISLADFIDYNRERSILVHCRAGVSRSAAVVRLLVELGWTPLPGCFFHHANVSVYNKLKRAASNYFPELKLIGQ